MELALSRGSFLAKESSSLKPKASGLCHFHPFLPYEKGLFVPAVQAGWWHGALPSRLAQQELCTDCFPVLGSLNLRRHHPVPGQAKVFMWEEEARLAREPRRAGMGAVGLCWGAHSFAPRSDPLRPHAGGREEEAGGGADGERDQLPEPTGGRPESFLQAHLQRLPEKLQHDQKEGERYLDREGQQHPSKFPPRANGAGCSGRRGALWVRTCTSLLLSLLHVHHFPAAAPWAPHALRSLLCTLVCVCVCVGAVCLGPSAPAGEKSKGTGRCRCPG